MHSDGLEMLVRIHYNFFMKQSRFWYEHNLMEADGIIVNIASVMRKESKCESI
jgi:hypothetical protein